MTHCNATPEAIEAVASALYRLGTNNAATDMGAIEAHAMATENGAHAIAAGLHDIADAIRTSKGEE